jgi:20S proteasome alpha/beta subunit
MGQLIACAAPEGVLLAADSRAVMFEPYGEERFITLDRVMPVSSHVVLASAGAVEAHDLCQDFAAFAKGEGLTDMQALVEAAIPFFTSRYDEILRKMCEKVPPDPIINMYLVMAGYSANAGHLFVIWDRPQPPKIEYNKVTDVFTLPRRMGLEFKLNQLIKEKAPLSKLVEVAKAGMEKLAGQDEYLGAPFQYVTITKSGISKA